MPVSELWYDPTPGIEQQSMESAAAVELFPSQEPPTKQEKLCLLSK